MQTNAHGLPQLAVLSPSSILFLMVGVRIWSLGSVRFEKQTDGTRKRTLRADPDDESEFLKN
jgi:hypothetical protein